MHMYLSVYTHTQRDQKRTVKLTKVRRGWSQGLGLCFVFVVEDAISQLPAAMMGSYPFRTIRQKKLLFL